MQKDLIFTPNVVLWSENEVFLYNNMVLGSVKIYKNRYLNL